jgi:hypothetical protein
MSIRRGNLGATAAPLVLGGVSAATTLTAAAATPSCGLTCLDVFSVYGTFLDVGSHQVDPAVGQPIVLARASNANPGEDFEFGSQGTVAEYYEAGLVGAAINLAYSSFSAYEIQYAPFGLDTGLCVGAGATPTEGTQITLQLCGVSAKTVWIVDSNQTTGSSFALIDAATASNFADRTC